MFGILLLLFTVVPAIELILLFKIGAKLGALSTFLIILSTGIVGAYLAKSQGLTIIKKIQHELANGELPAHQLIHGVLVFAGGLLLLTPGFLTDILGLMMVFPGTRHGIAVFLKASLAKAMANGNIKFMSSMHSSHDPNDDNFFSSQTNKYNTNQETFVSNSPNKNDDIEVEFREKN